MKKSIIIILTLCIFGVVLFTNIDHIKGNTVFIGKGLYEEENATVGTVSLERKDIRKEHNYSKTATIASINYKENLIFVNDGTDVWCFDGIQDYHINDKVNIVFNDKATNTRYDDEIIKVEKMS